MIANTTGAADKPMGKKSVRARKKTATTDTAFVMLTFNKSDQEVKEAFDRLAKSLDWKSARLAREMIRKYLGYTTHLP